MKKLRITVGGKTYEVAVEILNDETQQKPVVSPAAAISAASVGPVTAVASQAPAAAAAAGPGVVPSPLAGKVVSVDVKAGQAVQEGDQLLVLEAMKMNTYIYAPQSGTVGDVMIAVGDAVEEGQPLVRITA